MFRGLVLAAVCCVAVVSTVRADERYWPPIVDPPTGTHEPGRWIWADLVTSDVASAAGFYSAVFGWSYETYGSADDRDTYTVVLADGLPIAGMLFDARAMRDGAPSARWIAFASVPDVTAAAGAAVRLGGKIVLEPRELGERGATAVLADPEGAVFGAIRSKSGDPPNYLADLNEWVWIDLWTNDVERASAFYSDVVGYDQAMKTPDDETREGRYLVAGGYARAGVMKKLATGSTTAWIPYVRVADAAAVAEKARAAGGRVLVEPARLRSAVVAIIADPTGAPVGIAQLDRGQGRP